ncbi:binding-protein-dependent transport systems inner membrane component [Beutenbergia cavernae DSM 12333]|uniref:Binding-protein-dependent transport systems inner membrane component n=1 Tax=Beutenbergia cavernae (strain ATCC BAA-8 / DSM 12333 / CCUG 43141 / JCM 11478 / NBRC 16432 / NCIMB 13614 / HKI 0122) TaxID=471853 RepID=C5BVI8_BEUC1|nr:ABC transporter permease [Beutenbergia cavernae]ACQ78428.1 binding-protein-dependent transport systems inner membrane component [Beutenbergia cavernae DSM 12333]
MTTSALPAVRAPRRTARGSGSAHTLGRFLLRRLVITVFLLLGVTAVTFLLVQLVPGDSMTATLSETALADPEVVAAYRAKWGLDEPLLTQYGIYLSNLLQGDLGVSTQTGRPVLGDLLTYVPATLEIALPAMVLSVVIGTAVGLYAAVRQGRAGDQVVRVGTLLGLSTPPFWLSLVALYVFFYLLGVAPSGGRLSTYLSPPPRVTGMFTLDALLAGQWMVWWDAVQHLVLPVAVLTCLTVATLVRFVRSAMLEVLDQDYIAAARAKGLPTSVVLRRHVLRAGLVPVITVSGLAFAALLSGTVLVEQIFSWPGVGQYAYRAASGLDLPAVIGVGLFVAVVYTIVNLVVDLLYGVIDPRIRLS